MYWLCLRVRPGIIQMDPNHADGAYCFHLLKAFSFYHRDKRGCSDTEALVLSLLLANYEEGYAVVSWAKDSLEDVTDYSDGVYWPTPAAWKLKEDQSYLVFYVSGSVLIRHMSD